jgi:quercetin dioxygenase-like cupin family protein
MLLSVLTPIRPMRATRFSFAVFLATVGLAIIACDRSPTNTSDEAAHPSSDAPQGNVVLPVAVEILARGAFVDDVVATFRIKLDQATNFVQVSDPSDVIHAKITWQPGAATAWHTHPGPVLVSVVSGAVTYVEASDCESHVYGVGQAFIDPGQGHVHIGRNDTAGETVAYATFLDVPTGQGPTILADDPGCPS